MPSTDPMWDDPMIEYRTNSGRRIEINANGRIVPGTGPVNLRSLGCPEWLAAKVEKSRTDHDEDAKRRAKARELGEQIAADNAKFGA